MPKTRWQKHDGSSHCPVKLGLCVDYCVWGMGPVERCVVAACVHWDCVKWYRLTDSDNDLDCLPTEEDGWILTTGYKFTVEAWPVIDVMYRDGSVTRNMSTRKKDGGRRLFPASIEFYKPHKKEAAVPTIDNVNNWFQVKPANQLGAWQHEAFYIGEPEHLYPIIGKVTMLDCGTAWPAAWNFDGMCVLFCSEQHRPNLKMFDLVPITAAQKDLAEKLAGLWPHIDKRFQFCTLNRFGRPMFWTNRPVDSGKGWLKRRSEDIYTVMNCVKIDTDLPEEMTLQERPADV